MPTLGNITFYANDPRRLAHFWADVFGYPHEEWEEPLKSQLLESGLTEEDLSKRALAEDPEGRGPRFFFHHADGAKEGRNRLHLDVNVARGPDDPPSDHSKLDAEKDRLVALGAMVVRLVEQEWGPWPERYWQMQDPEGNEFCLQ
ncbi:VOC family protein [Microbacterium sp. 4R-513]|uniref:VOC family protein n=1 Tax=Microbacterium sp. 4R-513 TaxID=2567934 RepID=UPI0013E1EBA3|nr:VOC family protein [Microbacterium sp. 4R-513]QIG40571.1 VOC family protein [Microbacterium sp. 4R-513]